MVIPKDHVLGRGGRDAKSSPQRHRFSAAFSQIHIEHIVSS